MGAGVPYLSASPAQLAAAVKGAAAAGAGHVTPIVLHLRPGAREWFLGWLRGAHPDLVPRYAELYGPGAYARKDYQARITAQVRALAGRARPPRSTSSCRSCKRFRCRRGPPGATPRSPRDGTSTPLTSIDPN